MNELALSKDINRIEMEIQFYKEKAGESIWEIGRRLNHVKEKKLVHGQFTDWVEKNLDISYRTANKMMKVAKELPKLPTSADLGTDALYLIATLPEEERGEELQKAEDGEPSTVRELQDLKKQLRDARAEAEAYKSQHKLRGDNLEVAHKQIKEQQRVIDHYATKKPEVVEKIVEVEKEVMHPHVDDLRSDNKQLSEALKKAQADADAATKRSESLENQINEMYEERKEVNEKSQRFDELTEGIRKLEGQYNRNQEMVVSHKRVLDTIRDGNQLLDTLAGLIYATDIETLVDNDLVVRELEKLIERVEWWLNDMNKKIDSTTILEGEIIYDE